MYFKIIQHDQIWLISGMLMFQQQKPNKEIHKLLHWKIKSGKKLGNVENTCVKKKNTYLLCFNLCKSWIR